MKIKKYIVKSLSEGKRQILEELGDDAVILSSRSFENSEDSQKNVEIVAAIDEKTYNERKSTKRPVKEKFAGLEKILAKTMNNNSQDSENGSNKNKGGVQDIHDEIFDLKLKIDEISELIKYKHSGSLGKVYNNLYKALRKAEVNDDLALKITGQVSEKYGNTNFQSALQGARDILTDNIYIKDPIIKSEKRQVMLFMGPTGGGKTSTLVKIAIVSKLVLNSNVLIVSADSYKVGGAEQLETFASISGIAFKSVYNAKELKSFLSEKSKFDLILVDTSGRNQNDPQLYSELSNLVKASSPNRIFLVQNATASENNFLNVLESFNRLNPTDLVLSKLDETHSIGGIISALETYNIPISYLSYGQAIPEDLEPADKDKLGKIILPDPNNKMSLKKIFDSK